MRRRDRQQLAIVAGTDRDWQIVLAWGWLVPYPNDRDRWIARAMSVDTSHDVTVTLRARAWHNTVSGWPFELVAADVVVGGTIAEYRLGAFYRFLEYGAVALVRARSADAVAAARATLVAALETARPDWRADGPLCLQDLFA